jgi:hypothetical protein
MEPTKKQKNKIVIFEAEGGSDKSFDGHRRDTIAISNSLISNNYQCDILFYRDEWSERLFEFCKDKYDGYIPRVNPGTISTGEEGFFNFLRKLSEYGVLGMSNPDEMIQFGSKEVLIKLVGTDLVPLDTYCYYDHDSFKQNFPTSLSYGERVFKQNRGSAGDGIWRVQVFDERVTNLVPGIALDSDVRLKCVEAKDNHVEYRTLSEFMDLCEKYFIGGGLAVDMKYLPRIVEGEARILLVGATPIFIVHKIPQDKADAFSATLFSGAKYTYLKPEEWPELVEFFKNNISVINERLGNFYVPLIWTADFILDYDENRNDKFVLGEINCSCVGFTSQLDFGIQELVAREVINRVKANNKI